MRPLGMVTTYERIIYNNMFENATTKTSSGENCIRFHLPVTINNTDRNVYQSILMKGLLSM